MSQPPARGRRGADAGEAPLPDEQIPEHKASREEGIPMPLPDWWVKALAENQFDDEFDDQFDDQFPRDAEAIMHGRIADNLFFNLNNIFFPKGRKKFNGRRKLFQ